MKSPQADAADHRCDLARRRAHEAEEDDECDKHQETAPEQVGNVEPSPA
jgi:hypothetical protein